MKLFVYEIKKALSKPMVIVTLILFIFVNLFKIYLVYQEERGNDPIWHGKYRLLQEIQGEITLEKLELIIGHYNELNRLIKSGEYSVEFDANTYTGYQFGDWNIFKEIYDEIDYLYHYPERTQEILTKAHENLELYSEAGNKYEIQRSRAIIERYDNRKITAYYDTIGLESYFSYDFSSLLILLLLVFILSFVFAGERDSGMDNLILTARNGKKYITKIKLLAAGVMSVGIALIFYAVDLITFDLFFGLNGLENPLYSLLSFTDTALLLNIGQFMALSLAIKIVGVLIFAMLILLFSTLFSEVLSALFLSLCSIFIFVGLNDLFEQAAGQLINPITLLTNRSLFSGFFTYNLGNNAVTSLTVIVALFVAYLTVIFAVTLFLQKNNISIGKNNLGSQIKAKWRAIWR